MRAPLFEALLGFLFPPRCAGCRKDGAFLCARCLGGLPRAQPPKHPKIEAALEYRNPVVRSTIWRLKYRGMRDLAALFGTLLHERLLALASDEALFAKGVRSAVVPIPLSPARLTERGFNHAGLIAEAICSEDVDGLFSCEPDLLAKVRETKSQMSLKHRAERLANLKGAFAVPVGMEVRGRSVILIDDVTTTGATFTEAMETLLRAGAKEVRAFAVAH
ncbi:hypothetical protein KW797_04950 [Candidatus Parcubacteria bacterium]|nr:hypothetical protein [Candidatus Parcubacteria bacterium]